MTVDFLVIGTSIDPHISAVLDRLSDEISVFRFNIDHYPEQLQLSITYLDSEPHIIAHHGDADFDITSPKVAWFRRLGKVGISPRIPQKYRQFCLGEAEQALEGILSLIRPSQWINEYWSTRRAANKPYQYHIAQTAGLTTPETLITNSSEFASSWLSENPIAIAKTLHSPLITRDDSVDGRTFGFSHLLTPEDRERLADVGVTPCQFQPYVEKAYEVRLTSLGERHFGVRIDAPPNEGREDWRPAAKECHYTAIELPESALIATAKMMATLNITYGASDWIVTPDGNTIFLETNPHGAWLWLEEEVLQLGITDYFAEYISHACTGVDEHATIHYT